jgi:hypothetical protein
MVAVQMSQGEITLKPLNTELLILCGNTACKNMQNCFDKGFLV